ncbi:MAG: DUF2656 domain-containing protein, partial [Waterburya sp.]
FNVSDKLTGRMLLSHNFHLNNNELPAFNREEFAQVFIDGLKEQSQINCSLIENPHWVVEILFPTDKFTAQDIGQMCGEILINKRKGQKPDFKLTTDTLILGGKKTTPVTNTSPTSLQPGEWGVDVVEAEQADVFLTEINWEVLTASKGSDEAEPPLRDRVFKIEFLAN